jgi:hypothetical protein
MDEGTILVYCYPSTFSLIFPPPSQTKCTVYTEYRQCVAVAVGGEWGGVLSCVVDHILQEIYYTLFLNRFRVVDHILQEIYYTLFLNRFRAYKTPSPPQTKMASKDDI